MDEDRLAAPINNALPNKHQPSAGASASGGGGGGGEKNDNGSGMNANKNLNVTIGDNDSDFSRTCSNNKRQKLMTKTRPVPRFLIKLFHMLSSESESNDDTSNILGWLPEDDTCFYVKDWVVLSKDILPKYFASTTESFKRQLNYYGFRKCYDRNAKPVILLADEKGATTTSQGSSVIYQHEDCLFTKGREDLLSQIQRSSASTKSSSKPILEQQKSSSHTVKQVFSTTEALPCGVVQSAGTCCRESSAEENDLLRHQVYALQNQVSLLRERLDNVETSMTRVELFMNSSLQQQQRLQNLQPFANRSDQLFKQNVNPLASMHQAVRNQQQPPLYSPFLRHGHSVGNSSSIALNNQINSSTPFQNPQHSLSGMIPRCGSLSGGVERLNTGESTSSTNWVMLQDVLMNENQSRLNIEASPNDGRHLSRRDSFHNPFAVAASRKNSDV